MNKKKKPTAKTITIKKTTAKKTAKPTKRRAKKSPRVSSKKQIPSQEQIEVRAYFISEYRQRLGWGADPFADWINAEQQLIAEA